VATGKRADLERGPLRFLFVLALAALPAGCLMPEPAAEPLEPVEPAAAASVDDPAAAGATGRVRTSEFAVEWVAVVNAAGRYAAVAGTGWPAFDVSDNATDALVEVAWTPAAPAHDRARVVLRSGGEDVAAVEGTSPIRIALPAGELAPREYVVFVGPTQVPGVAVRQAFQVLVTIFEERDFEAGYSALG